jgi:hypothetical protein
MQYAAFHRCSVVLSVLLVSLPQVLAAQYQSLSNVNDRPPTVEARQARLEFVPQLGMYMPVGLLTHGGDDATGETRRQVGAGGLGARLALHVVRRFSLEGTVFYSRSLVAVAENSTVEDIPSGVLLASVRSVVRVGRTQTGGWNVYFAPGVGVIVRHGAAWEGTSGMADGALVVATGARFPVGKSGTAFRVELEDFMSRAQFDPREAGVTKSRIHHDVILSTGFALPVGLR